MKFRAKWYEEKQVAVLTSDVLINKALEELTKEELVDLIESLTKLEDDEYICFAFTATNSKGTVRPCATAFVYGFGRWIARYLVGEGELTEAGWEEMQRLYGSDLNAKPTDQRRVCDGCSQGE